MGVVVSWLLPLCVNLIIREGEDYSGTLLPYLRVFFPIGGFKLVLLCLGA